MSELDTLIEQRDEVLSKVKRIAESCEGIENEENAARVTELNGKQAELIAVRDELKGKLSSIDGELSAIGKSIRELSSAGIDKILDAIKNQRWFWFKDKPKILFDRDTALLWADLNYFPYDNCGVDQINDHIDDYKGQWRIPNPFELWKMIEDKSFPFQEGNNWRIKNVDYWTVFHNGTYYYKDLDASGATSNMPQGTGCMIPCCDALVPMNYVNNLSPSNNFYSEREKLQFTLDIFVQNDLVPLFADESITQLYRQIYVEKPALLKQLAELEAQIAELQTNSLRLTANFDHRPLLAKYNVDVVNRSPIQYYQAVQSVGNALLDVLNEYESAQSETISDFSKLALRLNAKYTDSPHLTADENKLLADRQQFLAQHLELGVDDVKHQILSIKSQADDLSARIDRINHGSNSIVELAVLYVEPRVDFAFLVENAAHIVRAAQQRVDFFTQHRTFVTSVVAKWAAWTDNYKAFATNMHEELASLCRDDGIEPDTYDAWFNDWRSKRFTLEQRFLPLVEFALKGNLLSSDGEESAAERMLTILQTYRDDVDGFYLHERKNIYQKFAFQAGGELQEKFETESELYKLTEKFQRAVQEIIFGCERTEERMFLLRWAKPLSNVPITQLVTFIQERELDVISAEVLNQFAELRRQNFAAYLADSRAYGEALQKREKEYTALVFRMRKDLMKQ